MKQMFRMSRLQFVIVPGLILLVSGCAPKQDSRAQADTAPPSTASPQPMAGCGMMINGQMVYKDTHGAPCMDMSKPGNMMPNGVTMHVDPGETSTQPK